MAAVPGQKSGSDMVRGVCCFSGSVGRAGSGWGRQARDAKDYLGSWTIVHISGANHVRMGFHICHARWSTHQVQGPKNLALYVPFVLLDFICVPPY